MKLFVMLCAFAATTAASAQNLAQDANTFCAEQSTKTGRYLEGFGEISLTGKPMNPSVDWEVPYDTLIIRFPNRSVVLTIENTPVSALGDYIDTTIAHSENGLIPFGVVTDDADGNRIGIIQPFLSEDTPYCFSSAVQQN
jgi:hypothetical protein